ncbi:anti-anti-sigma factor [Sorangium cellulosum]|uniref:Anti-anti-sigma factor n=1 Tax=Sorangium cellulosum TaxID=56 RepID=A0A4P2PW49_SORCE|nr:PAS domain-containing protein [Sorangium cellulosum]AUX20959.1 anti-anti-sigma factor [Sorangium cellulosum]
MMDSRATQEQDPNGARAQRMLDAVSAIACVVDIEERRLTAHNAALARALGCAREDLSAHGLAVVSDRIHPDDVARLIPRAAGLKAARDGEVVECELRARGRDGDERTFAVRAELFARSEEGCAREILFTAEDVTERRRRELRLRRSETLLAAFCSRAPVLMYAKDRAGAFFLASRSLEELIGAAPGSLLGKTDRDLFPPEVASIYGDVDNVVRQRGAPLEAEETVPLPRGERTFFSIKFPVGGDGIPEGSIAGISVDITGVKAAEREREAARDELIAAQQDTIRELVTPLLPIAEGVLVMPLIGFVDDSRADRILEALLHGVEQHAAHIAIIDITGVKSVDVQVAEMLVEAARAAGLLGAKVVLTGIQPAIARTLIELGVDLQGVVTAGTLRGGIAYALSHRGHL